MADIFVFGDSIGYGAWDEKGGWVDRLKQYFHTQKLTQPESPATEVYNLSVDGDTSEDVAKRIKTELSARLRSWSSENDIVIVSIGTNDTYAKGGADRFRRSPEDFLGNIQQIVSTIQELNMRLAFISLDPVDEARTNPTADGHYWTNERINHFNNVLNQFCQQQQLPFLNLFTPQLALPDLAAHFFDGLHPNSLGHEWMYERIKPFVIGMLK